MDAHSFRRLIRESVLAVSLDRIECAVTLTSAADEFVYVNPAFTRRYGWREEEVIGLRPALLLPHNFPEADLGLLRKKIGEIGATWVGRLRNRDKHGAIFEVELATFQISLSEHLPPNLLLGISAEVDGLAVAINLLCAALCRVSFGLKSEPTGPLKRLDKHQQIASLQAHGYTTKEIAAFMGIGINTPNVILHRARRKR